MIKKLAFALLSVTASAAMATTYPGNGGTGFGGPVGGSGASLSLTNNATTLFGTITGSAASPQLFDELVIYIDSQAGGFTTTSGFTDTGGGDTLHKAISGFDGTIRGILNFAPTFGADFAIAISPTQAQFGGLYGLTAAGGTNFLGTVNLSPTNAAGPYTFSLSLASIGSPTSFNLATTYINAHSDIYRSNEAYNTVTGTANDGAGNFGRNDTLASFSTYTVAAVPEPATVLLLGPALLGGIFFVRRRRA